MRRGQKRYKVILYGITCIAMTSCAHYEYSIYDSSTLALGTIPLSARIEKFTDESRVGRVKEGAIDLEERWERPLVDMVSEAVFLDFTRNRIFSSVALGGEGQSALTITGTIRSFTWTFSPGLTTLLALGTPVLYFLGSPITRVKGDVALQIELLCNSTGEAVAKYSVGTSKRLWLGLYYNTGKASDIYLMSALLRETIEQAKIKIYADRDKIISYCPPIRQ